MVTRRLTIIAALAALMLTVPVAAAEPLTYVGTEDTCFAVYLGYPLVTTEDGSCDVGGGGNLVGSIVDTLEGVVLGVNTPVVSECVYVGLEHVGRCSDGVCDVVANLCHANDVKMH